VPDTTPDDPEPANPVTAIKLLGEKSLTLDYGAAYTDVGAYAVRGSLIENIEDIPAEDLLVASYINYREADGTFKGKVPAVDTNKAGEYKVVYEYTLPDGAKATDYDDARHEYIIRVVQVKPVIDVNGARAITVAQGTIYNDAGAFVVGNSMLLSPVKINYSVDGKFIGTVPAVDTTKPGLYKVVYEFTDVKGNVATDILRADHAYIIRSVTVEAQAAPIDPVTAVKLLGVNNIELAYGAAYTEVGAYAVRGTMPALSDLLAEDMLAPTLINYRDPTNAFKGSVGAVDSTKPGQYKVAFGYTLESGAPAPNYDNPKSTSIIRVIEVLPTLETVEARSVTVALGSAYENQGAYVVGTDIALTPVKINYSVNGVFVGTVPSIDTSKAGLYKVVYEYTDYYGNKATDVKKPSATNIIQQVTVK